MANEQYEIMQSPSGLWSIVIAGGELEVGFEDEANAARALERLRRNASRRAVLLASLARQPFAVLFVDFNEVACALASSLRDSTAEARAQVHELLSGPADQMTAVGLGHILEVVQHLL